MLRSFHGQVLRSRGLLQLARKRLVNTRAVLQEPIWTPFHLQGASQVGKNLDDLKYRGEYDAVDIAEMKKRRLVTERRSHGARNSNPPAKHMRSRSKIPEGTNDEILAFEVEALLEEASSNLTIPDGARDGLDEKQTRSTEPERFQEYTVEIVKQSSTGDGLAYSPTGNHIFVVPFTVPGDVVVAKPYSINQNYSHTVFIGLQKASPRREGITPKCKYFGECSGCQLQMIPYKDQLEHKRNIVINAFKNFSNLLPEKIPAVRDTMGSPLEYGYRTKLTPHFQKTKNTTSLPPIGFIKKGYKSVMDIESCPIGTDILQEGLKYQRKKVSDNMQYYKRGATILLRESTNRVPKSESRDPDTNGVALSTTLDYDAAPVSKELKTLSDDSPQYVTDFPTHTDYSTCVSDEKGTSTEFVGPYRFDNRAGTFFQNNNSILRPFTQYVYDQCVPKSDPSDASQDHPSKPIKYLLDAYCGSGLFTITLSPIFSSALGIDIDEFGIRAARQNAVNNGIENAGFIAADASDLFADVPYPRDQSLVIIDPPRKGASVDFLRQLCMFGAKRVIYVSCNVHTQARDVGLIVNGFEDLPGSWRYEIESIKGCDFFPQTGHVEGVCVLNRVDRIPDQMPALHEASAETQTSVAGP